MQELRRLIGKLGEVVLYCKWVPELRELGWKEISPAIKYSRFRLYGSQKETELCFFITEMCYKNSVSILWFSYKTEKKNENIIVIVLINLPPLPPRQWMKN